VPFTLKNRTRIIAAVNKHYQQRTHKFGIEVPKSVAHVKANDEKTGTTYWQEAMAPNQAIAVGYQFVRCHMIFDSNIGSLK
jgi:hypothetical protein